MLFFRESYCENAYDGIVDTYEQWKEICGEDYENPSLRSDKNGKEVWIPLVPGRPNSIDGYIIEMQAVGFIIEEVIKMDTNRENPSSVSIFVKKP